jgi:hypothetical protein
MEDKFHISTSFNPTPFFFWKTNVKPRDFGLGRNNIITIPKKLAKFLANFLKNPLG